MRDDLARTIELADAARKIAQGNQVAAQIADLVFVRISLVVYEEIVGAIEPRILIAGRDFGDGGLRRRSLFAANAAELGVVNQFRYRGVSAANRATSGFLRNFNSRKRMARASKSSKRPMRCSPFPMINFSVSAA